MDVRGYEGKAVSSEIADIFWFLGFPNLMIPNNSIPWLSLPRTTVSVWKVCEA